MLRDTQCWDQEKDLCSAHKQKHSLAIVILFVAITKHKVADNRSILLTGFPNSNSEKNLYQGSFFKSISSGLLSRVYRVHDRGEWKEEGEEDYEKKKEEKRDC